MHMSNSVAKLFRWFGSLSFSKKHPPNTCYCQIVPFSYFWPPGVCLFQRQRTHHPSRIPSHWSIPLNSLFTVWKRTQVGDSGGDALQFRSLPGTPHTCTDAHARLCLGQDKHYACAVLRIHSVSVYLKPLVQMIDHDAVSDGWGHSAGKRVLRV